MSQSTTDPIDVRLAIKPGPHLLIRVVNPSVILSTGPQRRDYGISSTPRVHSKMRMSVKQTCFQTALIKCYKERPGTSRPRQHPPDHRICRRRWEESLAAVKASTRTAVTVPRTPPMEKRRLIHEAKRRAKDEAERVSTALDV